MKKIIFTYGRINPPTKAHQQLFNQVIARARMLGVDHQAFFSYRSNSKTDPLPWEYKVSIIKQACPDLNISTNRSIKTPFQALESFSGIYHAAELVVGSDQVEEFKSRMAPYAEKWSIKLDVVSAGFRNSDATGISGVSATKLRNFAIQGQFEEFSNLLIGGLSQSTQKDIYQKVRAAFDK